MGAWIEIYSNHSQILHPLKVAPFMGAWIEIKEVVVCIRKKCLSHPLWVRGLKLYPQQILDIFLLVAPFMGAWIEILIFF